MKGMTLLKHHTNHSGPGTESPEPKPGTRPDEVPSPPTQPDILVPDPPSPPFGDPADPPQRPLKAKISDIPEQDAQREFMGSNNAGSL
jgi:hypothetical protein